MTKTTQKLYDFTEITKEFYSVDFNYLKLGYVKEYTYDGDPTQDLIAISNDGKFLINRAIVDYERNIQLIKWVMAMTDRQLKSKSSFYDFIRICVPGVRKLNDIKVSAFVKHKKLDSIKADFEQIRQWEIKRRSKKKDYGKCVKRRGELVCQV